MIKGIERTAPMIHFQYRGVQVRLHGLRQDAPPKMVSVDYEIIVETEEEDFGIFVIEPERGEGVVEPVVKAAHERMA